jgi:hypothetical protein
MAAKTINMVVGQRVSVAQISAINSGSGIADMNVNTQIIVSDLTGLAVDNPTRSVTALKAGTFTVSVRVVGKASPNALGSVINAAGDANGTDTIVVTAPPTASLSFTWGTPTF